MNAGEHTYGARLLLPLLCFSVPFPRTPLPLFPSCATTKERRRRRRRQRQKHDRSKSSTGKRGGRRKGEMLLSCTYVLRTLPPLPLCRTPSLSTVHFCFLPPSIPGAAAKRYSLTPPLCLSAVQLGMGALWVLGRGGERAAIEDEAPKTQQWDGRTDGRKPSSPSPL